MLNQDILTAAADNIECQRRDVSSSVTQQPNRLLSPRARRLISLLCGLAFLPLGIALANPNPPTNLCIEGSPDCEGGPTPSAGGVKWHPGHYMMQFVGTSDPEDQSLRFNFYDAIASNTAIQGGVIYVKWKELEVNQGDYTNGINYLRAEVNYLKNLAVPKRLWVRLIPQDYGNANCSLGDEFYPDYIINSGGCHTGTHHSVARLWDATIASHWINLIEALGAAFDDEPFFEGITLIRETAFGPPPSDFTSDAYITQLNRIALAGKQAFPKTNVVMNVNYIVGGQSVVNSLIADNRSIGVGQGGPDTAPKCINNNCSEGYANPQGIWAYNTVVGNNTGGGTASVGIHQIAYGVEASELGLDAVGQDGGYTPEEIFSFFDDYLKGSHLFWHRNEYYGTSEQRWSTGILPFINANSNFTNDSCPSSYTSGCDTN